MNREPRVVIIGAGVAGIATAVTLQRAGFQRLHDPGEGLRRRRRVALEPLPRPDVRRAVAAVSVLVCTESRTGRACSHPAARSSGYLRDVVEQFGLDATPSVERRGRSTPSSPGRRGTITTADGAKLEADFVIAATGVLHHPFTPDIPGLDSFAGDVVHTARWDDEPRDRRAADRGHRKRLDRRADRVRASTRLPTTSATSCGHRSG